MSELQRGVEHGHADDEGTRSIADGLLDEAPDLFAVQIVAEECSAVLDQALKVVGVAADVLVVHAHGREVAVVVRASI